MSHFSSALQQLIEARHPARGGQTQFARQVGLEQATISRWISDDNRPDVTMLEQLCLAINEEERANLVLAYLRDDVPPSARNLIRLVNLLTAGEAGKVTEDAPRPRDRMTKKLRDAFDIMEQQAVDSKEVADFILSTTALMRGERL